MPWAWAGFKLKEKVFQSIPIYDPCPFGQHMIWELSRQTWVHKLHIDHASADSLSFHSTLSLSVSYPVVLST